MRGGPHAVIGLGVGVALVAWRPDDALAVLGLATLGGLLPDIDHPGSMIGRRVSLIANLLNRTLEHRGAVHSLFAAELVAIAMLLATGNQAWSAALFLGYVSHLVADGFSLMGVPYLWPIPWMVRLLPRPLRVRSGNSWIEWPLALGVLATVMYWLVRGVSTAAD